MNDAEEKLKEEGRQEERKRVLAILAELYKDKREKWLECDWDEEDSNGQLAEMETLKQVRKAILRGMT